MKSSLLLAVLFGVLWHSNIAHHANDWNHGQGRYNGPVFPPKGHGMIGQEGHGHPRFQQKGYHQPMFGHEVHGRPMFENERSDFPLQSDNRDQLRPGIEIDDGRNGFFPKDDKFRNRNGFENVRGCFCLLYVEQTEVFRRSDLSPVYSCNLDGLNLCSNYCANLFNDAGLRGRSRQDACDVLGREVNVSWFRRDRVCGRDGPRQDTPLPSNLCCQGGRSTACQ